MKHLWRFSVAFVVAAAAFAQTPPLPDPGEFIRVAADRWHFEGAVSGRRFIPFGSNFVLTDKAALNVFGPSYDKERYAKLLDASAALNVNVVKVFLPIGAVLPDPQVPGEVHIAAGYFVNLDEFLGLCTARHIRVIVSLACWGGMGCQWWHEGGQYFGRAPWKQDAGMDSLDVLERFWRAFGERFANNPAIFAVTPAIEWSMPATNLTWFAPKGYSPVFAEEPGLWYWQRWAAAKYGSIEKANEAWGKQYANFEAVAPPNFDYDLSKHAYLDSVRMICDYQNFREWAALRYMRPQIAALRAADPNHLITISNHMRFWDLWEGAAFAFLGVTPSEQKPLVDYMTIHANFSEADPPVAGWPPSDIALYARALLRFAAAGAPMPVVLEEYSYVAADPAKTAEYQAAIVRENVGHVSGWLTWYLQFPENPQPGADPGAGALTSAWLDKDLAPTPWGLAARGVYDEIASGTMDRIPPVEIIPMDRCESLVPAKATILQQHRACAVRPAGPVDYAVTHEPDLDLQITAPAN